MTFENMWMVTKSVVLVGAAVVVVRAGMPFYAKMMGMLDAKEQLYNEQVLRIADNMVSQRIEFSNKLLQEKIETLNEQIKNVVEQRDQDIVAFGEIVAQLTQDMSEQIGNAYIDNTDSSKNYVETVIKKTMGTEEIPWSWAMYSPNIEGDEKWTTGTYPAKVHTKIAIGKNDDRSDAYVEAYMTSDVFNADKGKKFPLSIDSIEWVEAPLGPKKWMYNTRMSLGIGLSTSFFTSFEFSFFSYGRSKTDMDWRFASLGLGINDDDGFLYVSPFEYNLGKVVPYVENLFIGPFVGGDTDGDIIGGVGLQIPF